MSDPRQPAQRANPAEPAEDAALHRRDSNGSGYSGASTPGIDADAAGTQDALRTPSQAAPPRPSMTPPTGSRAARDPSGARRRLALRIPDDEISRPQLPDLARPSAPASEPQLPPDAGVTVTPMRIITISEPPPAVGDAHVPPPPETPVDLDAALRAAALRDEAMDDRSESSLDAVEVEVRFDDDPISSPAAVVPPVAPVPVAPSLSSVPASQLLGALVEPKGEDAVASDEVETPTPSFDLAATDAGWPAPPPSSLPVSRTEPAPPPAGEEADPPVQAERRSSTSDFPEIAAEDVVTVEPPPTKPVEVPPLRPASALPPMRPRAMSQPGAAPPAPPPPAPSGPSISAAVLSKPPPIPTPKPPLVIVPPHVGSMPSPGAETSATRRKTRLWWEELFNDDYLRAVEKNVDDQTDREVTFIEESLGVERGGALLDLACGTGRHAIELALRGYEVVGFDLSLAMLARAGDDAQDAGAKLNFVQGDMREMAFEEQFDGVYCWSTSFGYFEEDKNAQVVDRVHRALKSGGTFLLDVVNRDFLIRQSPSLAWFEGDGCVCMDEMTVDYITSRMKVKRTMMLDDGRSKEIDYSMRVYSLHELGRILHEHGFKVREVSGRIATPGVFFGDESPRTIILAEKK